MKEQEWLDRVRKIVRTHLGFLEQQRGWSFSTGGAASELVLRYASDRLTVTITIAPMELPFLTLTTHKPDEVNRPVRFAASGDSAAAKCAKKVYAEVESGRFEWPSKKVHPLIDEYITLQENAVRECLADESDLPRHRKLWKPV